ncbi:MBL fold metallo-hydrolase [Cryobacterium roopkundense]|nr:MBL fold metallo-hydrolase [Cryobacterium roopkundense]MBB5641132.1 glyoxylase-like metal-dependent hydrolase (beta-lactamase superfamily II) [Cryobacterium roopkundense]
MSTNSMILSGQGDALLIDPGWLPDELDALAASIRERGLTVVGGFATHAHHDHLLWHPGFGDSPRWASAKTAELADVERSALVELLGEFPEYLVNLMGRVRAVEDHIPAGSIPDGFDVELISHNGHAPGHTALWLPRQRVLIAGDILSDVELPLPFYPDDLPSYLDALDQLSPFIDKAKLVIPGHGTVGHDPAARLEADRRYIEEMTSRGESVDLRCRNVGMAEAHAHMQLLLRDADVVD